MERPSLERLKRIRENCECAEDTMYARVGQELLAEIDFLIAENEQLEAKLEEVQDDFRKHRWMRF